MSSDAELLRRYVEEGSETAFADLVHGHLNMVYSAALRELYGDGTLAEDLSQAVFTELARKAPRLVAHPALAGWLYTTVRHLGANLRRAEQHRRRREEEAQKMNELLSEDSPNETWQRIRPLLDDALHAMQESDRNALVLRFLEGRPLREVGERLGIQENAARMRVDRALERLRALLLRRGLTPTAAGLGAALALGVLTPAPKALAASIAATALAAGAAGAAVGSTTLTLMKLMSLTKVSLIGALVVASIAVPTWQQTRLQHLKAENSKLKAQDVPSPAQEELASLRDEVERLRKVHADQAELDRLRQWQAQAEPELLRLRGMAGVARRANAEAEQMRTQLTSQERESASNPVSSAMADAMKSAMEQQVNSRLSRLTATLHLTPGQTQTAREILSRQAQAMSAGMQQAFSGKYDKAELAKLGVGAGNTEEQLKALLTPDQIASYPSYQREEAAYNARVMANSELMQLQSLGLTSEQEDRAFAAIYGVSFDQLTGAAKPTTVNQAEAMQWTLDQKAKALEPVLTATQMESYRQQLAVQSKLAKDIWTKMSGADAEK